MFPLFRSAALAVVLFATPATVLVAQSDTRATPTNPACPLLTDQELDVTTGLDYGSGEAYNQTGQGIFGGATCLWGGVWNENTAKSLPQIGVVSSRPARTAVTQSSIADASRRRAAPERR